MRLLTHNFLQSNVRGTIDGYPLKIEATNVIIEKSTMDSILVRKMLKKLNYPALLVAVNDLKNAPVVRSSASLTLVEASNIPSESPKEGETIAESILKVLHFFLFDVHVLEGTLQCPGTGRKFPIKDGIPNMILHEDEI
mmetsp:Transcript_5070/g.12950  ORF Transcript_5070/g.12950 Transcript_5070/m.12950 type:complete len:139 (+) Transcript_5070:121-537(+)